MWFSTCSAKRILEKIRRDYDLSDESSSLNILENVFEGLEMLQTAPIFEVEEDLWEFDNWEYCIPEKVLEIMNVRVDGKVVIKNPYNFKGLAPDEYSVFHGKMFFGKKKGKALVGYKTFKMDEEGYPYIVCDPYVLEYLSKYWWYKASLIKHWQNKLSRNEYMSIKQEMEMSRTRAKASLNMPSVDDAESAARLWRQMFNWTKHKSEIYSLTHREQTHKQPYP